MEGVSIRLGVKYVDTYKSCFALVGPEAVGGHVEILCPIQFIRCTKVQYT